MPTPADRYRASGAWTGHTLWEIFARTAADHAARVYLVEGDHRTSFAAAAEAAARLATGLARLGVGTGNVVAFQLPNWTEAAVAYLACARLGAVANPCAVVFGARDLRFVLRQSAARVLLIPGVYRGVDHRALVRSIRGELPALEHTVVVRDDTGGGEHLRYASLAAAVVEPAGACRGNQPALLMYTSGSTAEPKGVRHSHDTLLAEARSLGPVHGLSAHDVTLMPSPLTHISGLVHAVLVPSVFGSTAVLMDRWEPPEALRLIAAERVTYMVGAPTFLRDLAHEQALAPCDTSSLRLFSCGGATVDPTLVRDAAARLGCLAKRVYGSTEFPTMTTTGPADPPERRIDSEGRPIGDAEIRLVDDDDEPVAPGDEGEIQARGPELFLGYQDASLDRDTFTHDGWFRTGDLGTCTADGFLRVTGRKKDVIIRKGENISAREVEDLIILHPAVAEVAVVGLPDVLAGEVACAVLRLRPDAPAPTLADVCAFLLDQGLSKRKLPERLAVVTAFPRAPSGKILKRALRGELSNQAAVQPSA